MNNSLRGAFWSGVIFPGMGQVVLKRYKRGAVIMLVVLVSMAVFIVKAVQHAIAILEKIALEGGEISMSTISNAATQASTNSGSLSFNLLMSVIIVCWILAVVDAYLIGKRIDIEQRFPSHPSNGSA